MANKREVDGAWNDKINRAIAEAEKNKKKAPAKKTTKPTKKAAPKKKRG